MGKGFGFVLALLGVISFYLSYKSDIVGFTFPTGGETALFYIGVILVIVGLWKMFVSGHTYRS